MTLFDRRAVTRRFSKQFFFPLLDWPTLSQLVLRPFSLFPLSLSFPSSKRRYGSKKCLQTQRHLAHPREHSKVLSVTGVCCCSWRPPSSTSTFTSPTSASTSSTSTSSSKQAAVAPRRQRPGDPRPGPRRHRPNRRTEPVRVEPGGGGGAGRAGLAVLLGGGRPGVLGGAAGAPIAVPGLAGRHRPRPGPRCGCGTPSRRIKRGRSPALQTQ